MIGLVVGDRKHWKEAWIGYLHPLYDLIYRGFRPGLPEQGFQGELGLEWSLIRWRKWTWNRHLCPDYLHLYRSHSNPPDV